MVSVQLITKCHGIDHRAIVTYTARPARQCVHIMNFISNNNEKSNSMLCLEHGRLVWLLVWYRRLAESLA